MTLTNAAMSGLVGAATVTVINETVRRASPQSAPRMEILGMRALAKGFAAADEVIPQRRDLIKIAMAGDMVSNTAYYSLVGAAGPDNALAAGAALGLAAGLGAVMLPGPLGLGEEPSGRSPQTKLMTVAWYLAGGIAAGLVSRALSNERRTQSAG